MYSSTFLRTILQTGIKYLSYQVPPS